MSTFTAVTGPTQFVEANEIRFAYRRFGKAGSPTFATSKGLTAIPTRSFRDLAAQVFTS
jgi:hypothetical protein